MSEPSTDAPGRWPVGADEVETLLDAGELERVTPSAGHADLLMSQAAGHLAAAAVLVDQHPPSAYSLLYDAARKAMTGVPARQGLRPTSTGGHRVVQDAIEAQLRNARAVVRPFRNLRIRRHDSEYPEVDSLPVDEQEAREALAESTAIVAAMRTFSPRVGPF